MFAAPVGRGGPGAPGGPGVPHAIAQVQAIGKMKNKRMLKFPYMTPAPAFSSFADGGHGPRNTAGENPKPDLLPGATAVKERPDTLTSSMGTPIDFDRSSPSFILHSENVADMIQAYVETRRKEIALISTDVNVEPTDDQNAELQSLNFAQTMMSGSLTGIENEYWMDFIKWILGMPATQNDYNESPWLDDLQHGRNSAVYTPVRHSLAYQSKQIGEFVYMFSKLRMRFLHQLKLLKLEGYKLTNITEAYLYYKYIVRAGNNNWMQELTGLGHDFIDHTSRAWNTRVQTYANLIAQVHTVQAHQGGLAAMLQLTQQMAASAGGVVSFMNTAYPMPSSSNGSTQQFALPSNVYTGLPDAPPQSIHQQHQQPTSAIPSITAIDTQTLSTVFSQSNNLPFTLHASTIQAIQTHQGTGVNTLLNDIHETSKAREMVEICAHNTATTLLTSANNSVTLQNVVTSKIGTTGGTITNNGDSQGGQLPSFKVTRQAGVAPQQSYEGEGDHLPSFKVTGASKNDASERIEYLKAAIETAKNKRTIAADAYGISTKTVTSGDQSAKIAKEHSLLDEQITLGNHIDKYEEELIGLEGGTALYASQQSQNTKEHDTLAMALKQAENRVAQLQQQVSVLESKVQQAPNLPNAELVVASDGALITDKLAAMNIELLQAKAECEQRKNESKSYHDEYEKLKNKHTKDISDIELRYQTQLSTLTGDLSKQQEATQTNTQLNGQLQTLDQQYQATVTKYNTDSAQMKGQIEQLQKELEAAKAESATKYTEEKVKQLTQQHGQAIEHYRQANMELEKQRIQAETAVGILNAKLKDANSSLQQAQAQTTGSQTQTQLELDSLTRARDILNTQLLAAQQKAAEATKAKDELQGVVDKQNISLSNSYTKNSVDDHVKELAEQIKHLEDGITVAYDKNTTAEADYKNAIKKLKDDAAAAAETHKNEREFDRNMLKQYSSPEEVEELKKRYMRECKALYDGDVIKLQKQYGIDISARDSAVDNAKQEAINALSAKQLTEGQLNALQKTHDNNVFLLQQAQQLITEKSQINDTTLTTLKGIIDEIMADVNNTKQEREQLLTIILNILKTMQYDQAYAVYIANVQSYVAEMKASGVHVNSQLAADAQNSTSPMVTGNMEDPENDQLPRRKRRRTAALDDDPGNAVDAPDDARNAVSHKDRNMPSAQEQAEMDRRGPQANQFSIPVEASGTNGTASAMEEEEEIQPKQTWSRKGKTIRDDDTAELQTDIFPPGESVAADPFSMTEDQEQSQNAEERKRQNERLDKEQAHKDKFKTAGRAPQPNIKGVDNRTAEDILITHGLDYAAVRRAYIFLKTNGEVDPTIDALIDKAVDDINQLHKIHDDISLPLYITYYLEDVNRNSNGTPFIHTQVFESIYSPDDYL